MTAWFLRSSESLPVASVRPSAITTTWSQILSTTFRLCSTMMKVMPGLLERLEMAFEELDEGRVDPGERLVEDHQLGSPMTPGPAPAAASGRR